MSYEIVKSIKVKDGKVFIKSDSNNVRPRHFQEWECASLTAILQKEGQEALDLEILRAYEEGNFQRSKNKYTRALSILQHMPEYEHFDWRPGDKDREKEDFKKLLKKALAMKLPKEKFIIKKDYFEKAVYLHSRTRNFSRWTTEKESAKVFRWLKDAVNFRACFTNSKDWQIEEI